MNITLELSNLRADYDIKDINVVEGQVVAENIVFNNREYAFVDDDLGYTAKTALSLIRKHSSKLRGKFAIVRYSPYSGALYNIWGLYASTSLRTV